MLDEKDLLAIAQLMDMKLAQQKMRSCKKPPK